MAASWVARVHRALAVSVQRGLRFPVRVEPHGFAWAGGELGTLDAALEDLRFALESRGIRELTIASDVEPWELRALLELLNTPAEALGRLGGAETCLRERGVLRVRVVAPGDAGDGWQDGERATREALQRGRDAVDVFADAVVALAEVRLAELAYDRAGLAAWLGAVAGGDAARLYAAVRLLHDASEQGADREVRTRTLVEALLALPPDLLRPFFTDHLALGAAQEALALNLLSQLTEDEVRHVAAELMPREALFALTSELLEFPWEEAKRHRLLEALTAAVDAGPGPAARAVSPPKEDEEDEERILDEVRAEIEAACQPDVLLERSADILLALALTADGEPSLSAPDALEELVGEALGRGRLDLAVRVLASLRTATGLGAGHDREQARQLALVHQRLGGRAHVALAAGFLRRPPDSDRWLGHVAEYLALAPVEAIEAFTELLAEERDRPVRARMCQVLTRIGPPAVPSLLNWLRDPRWYVVRNVVHVLGRIGAPAAFEPVAALLAHAHPRVRTEAVRALGLLDPARAASLLLQALAEANPALRSDLVRALAGLGRDEAVGALRELALGRDGADVALRREAVDALAAIGSPAARDALSAIARRRLWPWDRIERRVRRRARRALAALTRAAEPDDD
jgi:hypothetical protein